MSNRQQHIIQATQTLLQNTPLNKLTIASIAKQANISVGSVYLEFPSKTQLLQMLCREHLQSILRTTRKASMRPSTSDGLHNILWAKTKAIMELTLNHSYFPALLSHELSNQCLSQFKQEQLDLLTDYLEANDDTYHLQKSAQNTAHSLLTAFYTFDIPFIFEQNQQNVPEYFEDLMKIVTLGIFVKQQ